MNHKTESDRFEVINPKPEHFIAIQELCKRVYPFTKPWSLGQLEAHNAYFPDGQLVVIDKQENKVVGLAFSLIISWDDYSPQDNWQDFTSSGFFHNHNPKKGKTLYGAEVMVDPEYRGQGLGRMLYEARREIAQKYHLTRIRAGARLRGYSKYKDKYSPEEYVKRVYEKEIFDPTLSFQLSKGFVPLDVARNYLFNDPESLGFAAVIEWLNPAMAQEKDILKQEENVKFFMTHQRLNVEHLPKELRRVVRKMTFLLGQVIREQEGNAFFEKVENYRKTLKSLRAKKKRSDLDLLSKKLKRETPDNQLKIAHSFSLLLEVVNSCESAYRTWRQRQKSNYPQKSSQLDLTFVLTAHPSEARSPLVIEFFRRITHILIDGLENNFVFSDEEIISHLRALLNIPLVKTKAPTVIDEAEYIYSMIFHPSTFDFILSQREPYRIRLRTWVGGDKDGHPGVDEVVMLECLSRSRAHLIDHIASKITLALEDLEKLSAHFPSHAQDKKALQGLLAKLPALKKFQPGDGKKVDTWKFTFYRTGEKVSSYIGNHHELQLIYRMFEIFPSLVLPIELREDATKIKEAISDKHAAISRMITKLSDLSKGAHVTNYARGLVISHCEESKDLFNAQKLLTKMGLKNTLPLIPLFESRESLKNSEKILTEWLDDKTVLKTIKEQWREKLEVMLGYSDSAKQIGVFPSRSLIKSAMNKVNRVSKRHHLKTVFFHGSGGSVARGGGSLREQLSWWPSAATRQPKLTIQGEMIQRTFATKEILHSQCLHFAREAHLRKSRKSIPKAPKALDLLSRATEKFYLDFVNNEELLSQCLDSTPYRYLELLKIGSRPSKRPTAKVSTDSLRAIPWVLCWTQSRVLLPTWWGVGSAWETLTTEEKADLKKHFTEDPFFSSFVKQLSFTLAKVELLLWQQYLNAFEPEKADEILQIFETEYKKAAQFCFEVTQKSSLMWHRPWLEESIKLRSPYVHLLNLLQINAMKTGNEKLLKETLVGIACGMLTTG